MEAIYNICEIEFIYKTKVPSSERIKINSSGDAARAIRPFFEKIGIETKEAAYLLLMNIANQVVGVYLLSIGGLDSTIVDIKYFVITLAKSLATSVIFFHNHPSENCNPSQPDINITEKLKKAAQIVDSKLLDSIILMPDDRYYSFADEGRI